MNDHITEVEQGGYFWYSSIRDEEEIQRHGKYLPKMFCKLDNGEIKQYTQWTDSPDVFDTAYPDQVYLGHGVFDHCEVEE